MSEHRYNFARWFEWMLVAACFSCGAPESPLAEQQSANNANPNPTSCYPNCARGTKQVSAGGLHTCALSFHGDVQCWGASSSGQLGVGNVQDQDSPVLLSTISNVTQIATGYAHTCALIAGGTVMCWGQNARGQLGLGDTNNRVWPWPVPELDNVREIVAGGQHTCARLYSGEVYCWGRNSDGAVGDGTFVDRSSPALVPGLSATDLAAGGSGWGKDLTCAVRADTTVACWGANDTAQLANTSGNDSAVPVSIGRLFGAVEVAAGADVACARMDTGKVHCWGEDDVGAVGNGSINQQSIVSTPSKIVIPLIAEVRQIALGSDVISRSHGCALMDETNHLKCWGWGVSGELGVSQDPTIEFTPLDVNVMINVHSVSAGGEHTCGLRGSMYSGAGLELKCWGENGNGQLGTGGVPDEAFQAVVVPLSW